MAVAASPKLWMVSDRRATLPDISTTTSCKRAVAISPTKDHLMAQMPRSEVTIVGSTAPWVWPCPHVRGGRAGVLRYGRATRGRFYPPMSIIHLSAWKAHSANYFALTECWEVVTVFSHSPSRERDIPDT